MRVEYLTEKQIKAKVDDLLEWFYIRDYRLGVEDVSKDVDVVKLANEMGFIVQFEDLKSIFGENTLGTIFPQSKVILCDNSIEPVGKDKETKEHILRFTIAHEIGHYLLHRKYMEDSKSTLHHTKLNKREQSRIEIQANMVAAMLLMPENLFSRRFKLLALKHGLYQKKSISVYAAVIKELSAYFNASKKAVGYRIKELKDKIWR